MTMTSVLGHLIDMDFAAPYDKWNTCNPVTLFTAPISYKVRQTISYALFLTKVYFYF